MSAKGDFQERYRRVTHLLEGHPHLSGLMTDEAIANVGMLCIEMGGLEHFEMWKPIDPTPDFGLEVGYEDIPAEDEPGWVPRHAD